MKLHIFKRIPALLIAVIFTVCCTAFMPGNDNKAAAKDYDAEIEAKQEELEETKALISDLQSSMDQRETEAAELKIKIAEIELEIAEKDKEIAENREKIQELSEELDSIQTEISDIDTKKEEFKEGMEERLSAIYMHSLYDDLEYLMDSSSIVDFINRVDTISTICSYDAKQLHEYEVYEEEIEAKEDEVLAKRSQYASIEARLTADEEEIQALYDANVENQAKLDDEIEYYIQAKTEEEEEAEQIAKQVKLLQSDYSNYKAVLAQKAIANYDSTGNNPSIDGTLIWPLPGVTHISSYFGYRLHPVYGIYKYHSGVDISGAGCTGKDIVAVRDGVVTYSGWSSGYGYNVVVYHGDSFSTLYAHCSSLCVSVGEEVQQGDVIAKVGMTGVATGPHLHFEIIIDGVQVDPLQFYDCYD